MTRTLRFDPWLGPIHHTPKSYKKCCRTKEVDHKIKSSDWTMLNCSISSSLTMEILQLCTKLLIGARERFQMNGWISKFHIILWNVITYSCPWILLYWHFAMHHIHGLVQDCGNSIASAMELPQSCTKPWKWSFSIYKQRIPLLLVL